MNILVIDVPAETSGALSILKNFHKEVLEYKNETINWYFVLSTPYLEENENLTVLRFPWIKKSWFHRLFFDYVIAPKILKKYNIDYVFSLQNTTVHFTNKPQIIYLHQMLPFIKKKYKIFENPKFWVYQNLISKVIFHSLKKANRVIVQGEWLKKEVVNLINIDEQKIEVVKPSFTVPKIMPDEPRFQCDKKIFFYPATEFEYKNHHLIIEAVEYLIENNEINNNDIEIVFTLNGEENTYSSELYRLVSEKNLPINFVGNMDKLSVYKYYYESTLIFPSYIEAFGLPLLEARLCNAIVLCSDMPFSREVLSNYENAYFYDYQNHTELAALMRAVMKNEIIPKESHSNIEYEENKKSLLEVIMQSFK